MTPCSRVTYLLLALIILTLAVTSHAKRGCASFGHSCFGGHGKRSDVSADNEARINHIFSFDPMDYQALQFFRQLCTLQPYQYVRMASVFRRLVDSYKAESEERLPRK